MTEGTDRLDRIEGILGEVTGTLKEVTAELKGVSQNIAQNNAETSQNNAEASQNIVRLSVETREATANIAGLTGGLVEVRAILHEVAARQRYHDEAFERFDARMAVIQENVAVDSENIRALARIAEHHNRRLEGLEGGAV